MIVGQNSKDTGDPGRWTAPPDPLPGTGPAEFRLADLRAAAALPAPPSGVEPGGVEPRGVEPRGVEPRGGGRLPGAERREHPAAMEQPGAAEQEPQRRAPFVADEPGTAELVRPYFRTKGRTKPNLELSLEALVSTSEKGMNPAEMRIAEHRSICELCADTRSVAEVAAFLRLPLGVARVLIADVASLGLVFVHSTSHMAGDRPSIDFMERVLSGLKTV